MQKPEFFQENKIPRDLRYKQITQSTREGQTEYLINKKEKNLSSWRLCRPRRPVSENQRKQKDCQKKKKKNQQIT